MQPEIRSEYNRLFTRERYQTFKESIAKMVDHVPPFRIAETPVFIPKELKQLLCDACNEINKVVCDPDFKQRTDNAIKHPTLKVPGEDYHTRFLQMDFGICQDASGRSIPQLIELQGFPSLYFFQELLSEQYRKHFYIPEGYSVFVDDLNMQSYIELLRKVIIGDNDPINVVLLEVEPEKQVTNIDFLRAQQHLGLKVLCISNLKKEGRKLFYLDEQGNKIPVYKIYNRVIFDELNKRPDIKREFYFKDEVDVEWVGHPNWFFRISKYIMPLLNGSRFVPDSLYLDQIDRYPDDLSQYVLKPLYSFAGSGVQLNITPQLLDDLTDRENYILQKRVAYHPFPIAPDGGVKVEIRMLMIWEHGKPTARIVNNLVRLSKGAMIGVKYNKDKDWVGASVGFFEPG
ncbi:MAG: hypothetical protein DHS20C17_09350 [Cyclobacteriaceae bacterium]|nr:MAG: hypothetical protein DHS20C17_09350 [Cyclobacteriaceae bacterium]